MSSSHADVPDEPPPSYDAATAQNTTQAHSSSTLQVPHRTRNGIPPEYRRSIEDEGRPLPPGWVRQFDAENDHQFFVDTNHEPPRSIWHHPYDDDEYINSLSPAERQRIQAEMVVPGQADIVAESSDDDASHHDPPKGKPANTKTSPSSEQAKPSFGRRWKDKVTGTTHEQRQEQRRQRAIAEEQAYQHHRQIRQAMVQAIQTGQPQFAGKDRDGKDLYIEPPQGAYPGQRGNGFNPYQQGPYSNPNARFVRPVHPYQRPYGRGYGGGYGLPLAGGLLGGLLLGDAIGGGFGGGGL